jgi:uncharacterized zinc-type alcohol dehydrogenase-like protein
MTATRGLAATEIKGQLEPFEFERRDPGPEDVALDITHCGICHSDLHFVDNDWGRSVYPIVPGHEIVGRVTAVGSGVTKFAVGDLAAIGCLIDSCRECSYCQAGNEHLCERGQTPTYGGLERDGKTPTYGGYSSHYVLDQRYALRVPAGLDPAATAPLLCAGITTYSPLRQWNVGPGQRMGVVGLGGLGHMALKFGKAFGAEVTLFTTSAAKAEDAKRLGATNVVLSTERDQMRKTYRSLDFIIDTVSAPHDLTVLLNCLRADGTLCLVGMPGEPAPIAAGSLVGLRRRLAGSLIGGMPETQEMLDFCAANDITSDIESIEPGQVNEAYDRLRRADVKYRFVIDMAGLAG